MGNSAEGITWATSALVDPTLRSRLAGNFAAVNGEQVVSADTNLSAPPAPGTEATNVPGGANLAVEAPEISLTIPPAERPSWILPALLISAVLVVVILIIALINSLLRNRSRRTKGG